jgi:hypothetical protein
MYYNIISETISSFMLIHRSSSFDCNAIPKVMYVHEESIEGKDQKPALKP